MVRYLPFLHVCLCCSHHSYRHPPLHFNRPFENSSCQTGIDHDPSQCRTKGVLDTTCCGKPSETACADGYLKSHISLCTSAVSGPDMQKYSCFKNRCPGEAEAGWELVRRTTGTSHAATDNLAGTEVYGTWNNDPASDSTFSVAFHSVVPQWYVRGVHV